jgi:uncharacterized membrane-anchored protein YitT (DUF2179 family)
MEVALQLVIFLIALIYMQLLVAFLVARAVAPVGALEVQQKLHHILAGLAETHFYLLAEAGEVLLLGILQPVQMGEITTQLVLQEQVVLGVLAVVVLV